MHQHAPRSPAGLFFILLKYTPHQQATDSYLFAFFVAFRLFCLFVDSLHLEGAVVVRERRKSRRTAESFEPRAHHSSPIIDSQEEKEQGTLFVQ